MIENFFILKNALQMPVYLLFFTKKKTIHKKNAGTSLAHTKHLKNLSILIFLSYLQES